MWTPQDWLNNLYSFYVEAVVNIVSRHGLNLGVNACHENQPNQYKLAVYKPSIYFNCSLKQQYISNKTECFNYKGGCGVTCIEAF